MKDKQIKIDCIYLPYCYTNPLNKNDNLVLVKRDFSIKKEDNENAVNFLFNTKCKIEKITWM